MNFGKYILACVLMVSTSVPALCSNDKAKTKAVQKKREANKSTRKLPGQSTLKKSNTVEYIQHEALDIPPMPEQSATPFKKRYINPDDIVTEATNAECEALTGQPRLKKSKDIERDAMLASKSDEDALIRLNAAAAHGQIHASQAQFLLGMREYNINGVRKQSNDPAFDPKFQAAFGWFFKATQHGVQNEEAQDMLGQIYLERGEFDSAHICFDLAAQSGTLASALFNLGHMCLKCPAFTDINKGVGLYVRAADMGYEKALLELGRIYTTDKTYIANFQLGCEYLKSLTKYKTREKTPRQRQAGELLTNAYYTMGMMQLNGTDGVEKDLEKAQQNLFRAAQRQHNEARFALGQLLLNPKEKFFNPQGAIEVLKVAAQCGHEGAKALLPQTCNYVFEMAQKHPLKTDADYKEAIRLFEEAAKLGHKDTQDRLKILHHDLGERLQQNGKTVGDQQDALAHFTKAKELGHPGADRVLPELHFQMGKIYEGERRPGEKQPALAVPHYEAAIEAGHVQASVRLANLYHLGLGVERDLVRAHNLFEKAATAGDKIAHAKLPGMKKILADAYREGKSVPADLVKALELMRESAKTFKGAADALPELMYTVAMAHWTGGTLTYDTAKTVALLTESQNLGYPEAEAKLVIVCRQLGQVHMTGERVATDLYQAIEYLQHAVNGGNELEDKQLLARARYELAMLRMKDNAPDIKEVAELLKQAKTDSKDAQSMLTTGFCEKAKQTLGTIPRNSTFQQAQNLVKRAMAMLWVSVGEKHADAEFELGMTFLRGIKFNDQIIQAANQELAIKHLTRAKEQGHEGAKQKLHHLQFTNLMNDLTSKNPDFAKNIPELERLAQEGHGQSRNNLGAMYYRYGQALSTGSNPRFTRSFPQAFTMLTKAAELNFIPAQSDLGLRYLRGENVDSNRGLAHKWLSLAASNGDQKAIEVLPQVKFQLAREILQNPQATPQQLVEALTLVAESEKDATQLRVIIAEAKYKLSLAYRDGNGVEQNEATSLEMLEQSAQAGHKPAQKALGESYFASKDPARLEQAVTLITQSGLESPVLAQAKLQLAKIYMSSANPNVDKARELFKDAAAEGLAEAQFSYGLLIRDTEPGTAFSMFNNAAMQGHPGAKLEAAASFIEGKVVGRNTVQGLKWAVECKLPAAAHLIQQLLQPAAEIAPVVCRTSDQEFTAFTQRVTPGAIDDYDCRNIMEGMLGEYTKKITNMWQKLANSPILVSSYGMNSCLKEDLANRGPSPYVHAYSLDDVTLLTFGENQVREVEPMLLLLDETENPIQLNVPEAARAIFMDTQRHIAEKMNAYGVTKKFAHDIRWNLPKATTIGQARAGLKALANLYLLAFEQFTIRKEGFEMTLGKKMSQSEKLWVDIYDQTEAQLEKDKDAVNHVIGQLDELILGIKDRIKNAGPRNRAFDRQPEFEPLVRAINPRPGVGDIIDLVL